jgi:hypothetical protein
VQPTPVVESDRALRLEFVQAFVDNARPAPSGERMVARPHILVLIAVIASATAVGWGVVAGLLNPTVAPAPAPVVAPPGAYVRVSGWDCGSADDHGFQATGRNAHWYTVATGGWAQDGCHGTFEAIPMSGNARAEDRDQYAVWWFTIDRTLRRCDVAVYVPRTSDTRAANGNPARFSVLDNPNGTPYATFTLNQRAARGSWVAVGSYPVNRGQLAIKLTNQGVPSVRDGHLAVSQVRVSCGG